MGSNPSLFFYEQAWVRYRHEETHPCVLAPTEGVITDARILPNPLHRPISFAVLK